LAIGDGSDVVRIKKALIAAAIKGRPPRELDAEPETEWTYYLGSSTGTTARTLQNLRVAGATIPLCGEKKGAVDISLKNAVNKELVDLRSRVAAERARYAILLASSDSDFAQEIRNFKSIGVRIGIVCGINVNNTYRDQSDFFVKWPIANASSSESAGKVKDALSKESVSLSSSSSTSAYDGDDSLEKLSQTWCDAIAEELVKVLDKGEEISLPLLGQVAAPLKPTGAPKSLKLEATIREDEKKRFKLNGEGTDIVVTFKSRGGGGKVVDSTFSTKSQASSSKGTSDASSDALRIQWCNSIYSKLNREFQVEGGLSLSTLGTLASDLRPVGGDSLRLEASLSEDSRFILIKGRDGTFARLRGGKRKGGRNEKSGSSNTATTSFRNPEKPEKEKSEKRNYSRNADGNDGNDIEQLREQWCDEIARVLEDELDANEEVFVSSLGVLVSSLRPPGGEGLKLEASLRADSRFEVQGKGLEAVVRLIDDTNTQSELTPSPFSELGYLAGSKLVSKGSELVSKGSEFLISILSPPIPSASVSKSSVVRDDSTAQNEEDKRLRDIEANEEAKRRAEEKARMDAAQQEEAIRIRRLDEESERKRQEQLKSSMMMAKKQGKWVRKGNEGHYVTIPSGTLVRYGAGDRWVESTIKFAFPFLISNDSFKIDPAPGVGKCLEVWEEGK